MANKTMTIAFTRGGVIPARHASGGKDKSVPPHEPVKVPEGYGKHLVADKFAYVPTKMKAAASGKAEVSSKTVKDPASQGAPVTATELDALKSAVAEAEAALATAETDEAKAAAEQVLASAQETLTDAGKNQA